LDRTTNYTYDAVDRQTAITDALGHATTYTYDAVGNRTQITDALGQTTKYSYNSLNRNTSITDALGQSSLAGYDHVGNVTTTTDKLGRVTNYGYDELNRKISTTDPLNHTNTNTYDKVGNIIKVTDDLGHQTQFVYDVLNRQTRQIDALNGNTDTSYDKVGNVTSITDAVGNQNTYTYDRLDRQITDTNQLGKTRIFSYDAVGNRIKTIDRNGRGIAYNYDVLDRETSENWLNTSNAIIKTFAYTYDAVGHLLTSTNPDSKYTYTYDAVDRFTSVDNTGTAGVPAVKFNYGYDTVGNLLTVNDSINGVNVGLTAYTYDLLNRATRLTQSGTGISNKRVDMAYNAVNRLTGISRFSDLAGTSAIAQTNYAYDNNQRLIQLSHKKGASTIANYDYSYDGNNRLTRTVSSIDGANDYSYDATNQLTGASHTTQTAEAYSYDANGNRTSAGYGTGVDNRLLTDGIYNYAYDDEGNRTRRTETATGKVTEYGWDYRNRLTGVLFKDALGVVSKTIEYTYDVDDRRIGKKIDGAVTERYVYDGLHIALAFDGAGNQTHRYLYGTEVDQILADETPTRVLWALTDRLGSVKDLVDENGVVLNHINYDSFGRVVSQTDASVEFRYGYTGREQDAETGLDYYRARYYDPTVGEFISEDPIGFNAGDTNLYRYVGNSPTNWIDPSGNQATAPARIPPQPARNVTPRSTGTGFGGSTLRTRTPNGSGIFVRPSFNPLYIPSNRPIGYPLPDGTYTTKDSNVQPRRTCVTKDGGTCDPDQFDPSKLNSQIQKAINPNFCPNPYSVPPQENNDKEKKKKTCSNGFVYRGDTRSPAQIRKAGGFWPRNPNGNISLREHVTQQRDNPKVDYSDIFVDIDKESQWVSTSKIEQYAASYSEIVKPGKAPGYGYLYEICQPPNGRDVSLDVERTPPGKEISFPGGINSKYIESYRKVKGPDDKIILEPGDAPRYILGRPTRFNR
jgi:RHS repeat-associated protein